MVAIFYTNNSEENRVTKTLSNATTFNINLKGGADVLNPTLRLKGDFNLILNYCYIADLNRYYFITDITNVNNDIYDISLSVDVLMSFKSEILSSSQNEQIISRQAVLANYYISDNLYPVQNRRTPPQTLSFPNGFNNQTPIVLLTVAGG